MKKRLFSTLFVMIICVCTLAVSIHTVNIVDSGQCNNTITWTLDSEGQLTITGTGDIPYYYYIPNKWNAENVKSILIENGITGIGSYVFYDCVNLLSLSIPNTVVKICDHAFSNCTNLTTATFEGNAPAEFDEDVFLNTPANFKIQYYEDTTG